MRSPRWTAAATMPFVRQLSRGIEEIIGGLEMVWKNPGHPLAALVNYGIVFAFYIARSLAAKKTNRIPSP